MLRQLENTLTLSRAGSPAKTFWRLGWIGFWTQIGFGSLPVILVVYALIFDRHSGSGTRAGNLLIEYLTFADLLIIGVHHGVVLPIHTACAAVSGSGTTTIPPRLAASSVDWGCRRRRGHRVWARQHCQPAWTLKTSARSFRPTRRV
jgi:hypothetical protein